MIELEFIEIPEYLKAFIRKITLFKSRESINYLQKITPSPYVCFSYNHCSIPAYQTSRKTYTFKHRLHLAGPKTDSGIYVKYNGVLHQILFEFKPCVFYSIFRKSPFGIENQLVPLEGFESGKICHSLEETLKNLDETENQIEIIGKYLVRKVEDNFQNINRRIQGAAQTMQEKNGLISKSELLDKSFLCERHFNRQFKKWIGISPKQFSKLVQLHAIIDTLFHNRELKLQEVALMYDFYDASHFINYFKNLTTSCPSIFIRRNDHIAMNYYRKILPEKARIKEYDLVN